MIAILSALGEDRPGIVAALTQVLYKHHLTIEDSEMYQLGGYFALSLIFKGEGKLEDINLALNQAQKNYNLTLSLQELDTLPKRVSPSHYISVDGRDSPGIVAGISKALSEAKINISSLQTRIIEPGGYLLRIEISTSIKTKRIEKLLRPLTDSKDLHLIVRHASQAKL